MAELKSDIVSEEARSDKIENDVIRLRMEVMASDHESEKNKIIKETENTIEELITSNEILNIIIDDQAGRMLQLDKESNGKDKEIKSLTERAEELSEQKNNLENDLMEAKEMYEQSSVKHTQQDEKIKKLELELSEVKKELEIIKIAKEKDASYLEEYMKKAEEKDEILQQKLETMQNMIKQNHEDTLRKMKSMAITSNSPAVKESRRSVMDVHSVQISFDSKNGRNDAAFHRITAFNNRKTCKPSKGNNNLSK